jgi:DNA recombination protein RmuC
VQTIFGLIIGLLIASLAFLIIRQRTALSNPPAPIEVTPLAPSMTNEQISATVSATVNTEVGKAVQSALAEALNAMRINATQDREESIKLASAQVVEKGDEQLGKRADIIDNTLKAVQDNVTQRLAELNTELKSLRDMNTEKFKGVDQAVSDLAKQTTDLNNVLSSSQARGQWGERMTEDLLRAAGLVEGINYEKQDTITGGGRPDYTFLMPPDRVLYMDVKFPLDSYAKYVGATEPTSREQLKREFMTAVRARVTELQKRDYVVSTTQHSLDYVLLFVPNESITGFVHEADPELIDWALERKVVLCSPLTLYAFLVVVRQATESFHTEETAAQIMQMMGKFKKQWEAYTKSLDKVKKNFDNLQEELDDLTVGKRFKGLGREIKKIDELRQRQNIAELPAEDDAVIDAEDYE